MYKNIKKRNENFKKLNEVADNIFNEFVNKTQEQFENGCLFLSAEIEINYKLESYIKMVIEEFELFCDTELKTIVKLLDNKFCEIELFENYSINKNFKYFENGKLEKILFIINATLAS